MIIGAAGGRIVSDDAILTVDIPAGALASNVTITLQPISNTAPGSFSSAYRLGPANQTFSSPVTLTIALPASVVDGIDVNTATIASQQDDGTWLPSPTTRNAATGSFSTTTTRFSDWSVISNLWIDPSFAAVDLGNSRSFTANVCPRNGNVVTQCTTNVSGTGVSLAWSVNGVAGGSATLGTVTSNGAQAVYRAPGSAPPGGRVTLTVSATTGSSARSIANANIQVGPQQSWGGTVEVTLVTVIGATTITINSIAQVSFRLNAGQQGYTPNGNMNVRYDIVNTTVPCETRASGARSIVDGDGLLTPVSVGGQTYYQPSGVASTRLLLSGTTTCNDQRRSEPFTLDQTGFIWWPGPSLGGAGYLIKSNGTVMQEDIQLPQSTGRVRWLLRAGQ